MEESDDSLRPYVALLHPSIAGTARPVPGTGRGIIVFSLTFLLVLLRKFFEVLRKFLEMQNIGKTQEKPPPEGRRGKFSDFLRYEALHEEDFWQKSNEEIFWAQKKKTIRPEGAGAPIVVQSRVSKPSVHLVPMILKSRVQKCGTRPGRGRSRRASEY